MRSLKVDKLGRVVIPMEMRRQLNLDEKTEIKISLENNSVVITPQIFLCKMCGLHIDNDFSLGICNACIIKIKSMH